MQHRDLDKQAGAQQCELSVLTSFPNCQPTEGTCITTHQPACDQLGSWDGPKHQDNCNSGVCASGKPPLSIIRESRPSPGSSQGHGPERSGRACPVCPWSLGPRLPHLQPQEGHLVVNGPGLGEETKRVPTPVHTGASSSLAPEPPLGPCPSPCCAIRQDTEREQTTGTTERRNCSRFSK